MLIDLILSFQGVFKSACISKCLVSFNNRVKDSFVAVSFCCDSYFHFMAGR